jgi:Na+/phosphate symporter
MSTPTAAPNVPFTAWEQAVFVALFAIVIWMLLRWFSGQQGKWNEFISKRDEQWQEFLANQRDIDQERYEGVEQAVSNLTKVTSGLVDEMQKMRSDFRAHDEMEREVLRKVRAKEPKKTK